MNNKICIRCKVMKDLNFFHDNPTGKRGKDSYCKSCRLEYSRNRYKNSNMEIKKIVFQHLLSNPCIKCGETDVLKLEFDHHTSKNFNLGKMTIGKRKNVEDIQAEISKCHVRCASCHKAKTHKEQNTWKYRMAMERKLHNG